MMRELSRMQYGLLACGDRSARGYQRGRGAGRRGRHHFSEHCRRDDRFEMGGRGGGRRREGGVVMVALAGEDASVVKSYSYWS
ncbi:hypothetical protein [Ignatzschineria indica]|uniref:hypothetical protein n=1 Tax=Ignatzschineria indica TaxID=472583 RepID=UPI00363EEDB2